LTASENRVKEFKQRNVGMMPKQGANFFSRLEAMNQALATAKLQLDEATRRRDEFRRQLDGVETLFEPEIIVHGPTASQPHPLDSRISTLEQNLDQLLLHYTEKHPDVISTRAIIADLQAEREATPVPAPPSLSADPSGATQNPLTTQVELSVRQAEAEVAGLTARVDEYNRRAEELKKMVDTVPRIEAELARLDRDYNVNKNNYDELVKRRESLSLSEKASQSADSVQFNIIDPPRVPLKPTGPDRPLFSAMVLAVGLGLGTGLAWLVAMMRPALYSRDEVEESFNIPVIGTVTRTWTRGEVLRRRMEVTTFVVGCAVLVATFSALITVELHSADLLDRVRDAAIFERVVEQVGKLV
jgi:polysaccharide chain length determinant protein (PEP-CTERM system associated)